MFGLMWKVWAKALGAKEFEKPHLADKVALVRTVLVLVNLVSAIAIIVNIVHHW